MKWVYLYGTAKTTCDARKEAQWEKLHVCAFIGKLCWGDVHHVEKELWIWGWHGMAVRVVRFVGKYILISSPLFVLP